MRRSTAFKMLVMIAITRLLTLSKAISLRASAHLRGDGVLYRCVLTAPASCHFDSKQNELNRVNSRRGTVAAACAATCMQQPRAARGVDLHEELQEAASHVTRHTSHISHTSPDAASVRKQRVDVLHHWHNPPLQPANHASITQSPWRQQQPPSPALDLLVHVVVHAVPKQQRCLIRKSGAVARVGAHDAVVQRAVERRSPLVDRLAHIRQLVHVHSIPNPNR